IKTDYLLHELTKNTTKVEVTRIEGGIGRLNSIDNLNTSYQEAILSLRVAHSQYTNHNYPNHKKRSEIFVKKFADLSIERIIFSKNPTTEINNLSAEYLQSIIDYDN